MPCTHTQLHSLGNWCLSHDRLLPKITRKIHQLQRDKQRQWASLHSRSNRPLQQLFSYFDRELSPVTFTSKLHLYNVKVNQHARGHSVQSLLSRYTDTHTGLICSTWTTKVVGTIKNNLLVKGTTWPNCMFKTPASEYNLSVVQIYTVKWHRQELYRVQKEMSHKHSASMCSISYSIC